MTTLYDISLQTVKLVTDTLEGAATAGAAGSLTDTVNLTQAAQYYDKGTLWINSGAHDGKVLAVTGFSGNKLSFAALPSAIAAGDRYSVIRYSYPWTQIVQAINDALDETYVLGENSTLIGDGVTLEFTLPVDVYNVEHVEFIRTGANYRPISTHWQERLGKLRFDYGYAPKSGDAIRIIHRKPHAEIAAYGDAISNEINRAWLKNKAAEKLLAWGMHVYGKQAEFRIEERMNMAMANLKGKNPRLDQPAFVVGS